MLPTIRSIQFGIVILFVLSACGGGSGSNSEPTVYAIGETGPAGGIVFYITDGGLHGLEAATVDQAIPSAPGAEWGCFGTVISKADGTAVGSGAQNTADILADCMESPIAADIAANYTLNSFSDWFLPSKDELNELFLQKDIVGGFAISSYWSSSEFPDINGFLAWSQNFDVAGVQGGANRTSLFGVRAVRAF